MGRMMTSFPKCLQGKTDCFGFEKGKCVVLTDTHFDKECPFYKTTPIKPPVDMKKLREQYDDEVW